MPAKLVSLANSVRRERVSSRLSTRGENGVLLDSERSAPRRARDCCWTESWRLSRKELTATSAATPTATVALRRMSRRGAALSSRKAILRAKGAVTRPYRPRFGHRPVEWCAEPGGRGPDRG